MDITLVEVVWLKGISTERLSLSYQNPKFQQSKRESLSPKVQIWESQFTIQKAITYPDLHTLYIAYIGSPGGSVWG